MFHEPRYRHTRDLTPAIWEGSLSTPFPDDFGDLVYDEKEDNELEQRVREALESNFTHALSHAAFGFGYLRHNSPAQLFPILKLQFERCSSPDYWVPLSGSKAVIDLPKTLHIIQCQIITSLGNEFLHSEDVFRMLAGVLITSSADLQHSALNVIMRLSFKAECLAPDVRKYLSKIDSFPFPPEQIQKLRYLATQFIYALEHRDEQGNPIDLKITSLKKIFRLTGMSSAPHPITGIFRSTLKGIEFENLIVEELTSAHGSQRIIEIESRYSNWNIEHILKVFRICSIPLMNESVALEFQIEKTDSFVLATGEFRSDSPMHGSARIRNYDGSIPVTVRELQRNNHRHLELTGDPDDLARFAAYLNGHDHSNLCLTNISSAPQSP